MPDRTWGDRPDCRVSASHFHMSAQQLQNLLTTAIIPTIIFHGNYILCQQKAAGKRSHPAEGIILSGVFKRKQDCSRMALWRIPRMGAEGESRYLCESLRQKDRERIQLSSLDSRFAGREDIFVVETFCPRDFPGDFFVHSKFPRSLTRAAGLQMRGNGEKQWTELQALYRGLLTL